MANEAGLWQLMRKHMVGHVVRLENQVGVGQPDVNGCALGTDWWMELKCIDAFPKRPATVVKVNHFTPEQRVWIHNRHQAGGRVFVFVRVGKDDFYLFNGISAAQGVGSTWNAEDWHLNALRHWQGRVDWLVFNQIVLGKGGV